MRSYRRPNDDVALAHAATEKALAEPGMTKDTLRDLIRKLDKAEPRSIACTPSPLAASSFCIHGMTTPASLVLEVFDPTSGRAYGKKCHLGAAKPQSGDNELNLAFLKG